MKWHGLDILTALKSGPKVISEIAEVTGMQAQAVKSALLVLVRRGLLNTGEGVAEITDKGRAWVDAGMEVMGGPRTEKVWSRRQTTLRDRAWRAMRIKRKFDLDTLLWVVANGDEKGAVHNLKRYARALERAGYLIPMRSGWLLPDDRDTGPLAPALNTRTRTVTDANTGERWSIG